MTISERGIFYSQKNAPIRSTTVSEFGEVSEVLKTSGKGAIVLDIDRSYINHPAQNVLRILERARDKQYRGDTLKTVLPKATEVILWTSRPKVLARNVVEEVRSIAKEYSVPVTLLAGLNKLVSRDSLLEHAESTGIRRAVVIGNSQIEKKGAEELAARGIAVHHIHIGR